MVLAYKLLNHSVQCGSNDTELGSDYNLKRCAEACLEKSACSYFISGTKEKAGMCWWEFTESADCPQGLENDDYNFYEVISMPY